jgi:hypothetical protein
MECEPYLCPVPKNIAASNSFQLVLLDSSPIMPAGIPRQLVVYPSSVKLFGPGDGNRIDAANAHFTRRTVRRLTAEQLADAVDFATGTREKYAGLPQRMNNRRQSGGSNQHPQ